MPFSIRTTPARKLTTSSENTAGFAKPHILFANEELYYEEWQCGNAAELATSQEEMSPVRAALMVNPDAHKSSFRRVAGTTSLIL